MVVSAKPEITIPVVASTMLIVERELKPLAFKAPPSKVALKVSTFKKLDGVTVPELKVALTMSSPTPPSKPSAAVSDVP